jgi:hypothetical protein
MFVAMSQKMLGSTRDPYTVALLHFDGANGYNGPFLDSANPARAWNAGGAAATLTTAAKKFGTASLNANGQLVSPGSHVDFDFGAGPFTVEYFCQLIAGAGDGKPTLMRDGGIVYTPWMMGYLQAGIHAFYASSNGASWDIASGRDMGVAAIDGIFHHHVVQREGTTFSTYFDGTRRAQWTSALAFPANTGPLCIGYWNGTYGFFNMDELRITKGKARYTGSPATITVPIAPFIP